MKKIIFITTMALVLASGYTAFQYFGKKCSATKNCSACKNCKYCKNCSKDGGSCGVCKK